MTTFWASRQTCYKAETRRLLQNYFREIRPESWDSLKYKLLCDYRALVNSEQILQFDEKYFEEYWQLLYEADGDNTDLSQLRPTSTLQVETYRALAKQCQADRQRSDRDKDLSSEERRRRSRKTNAQNKLELAESFYRLVKTVNLLNIVPSILERLEKFRRLVHEKQVEVKIEWIKCKGGYQAKRDDIVSRLRDQFANHHSLKLRGMMQ